MAARASGITHLYLLAILGGFGDSKSSQVWVSNHSETANWAEARARCEGRHGHLYVESPSFSLDSLRGKLDTDSEYWVGARVNTQSWTWDGTNDPLYTYKGYAPASLVKMNDRRNQSLEDNQAFTCFTHCATHYVALQYQYCVCLNQSESIIASNTTTMSVKCPGNADEHCGNNTGYSIYHDPISYIYKFRINRGNNAYFIIWAYLENYGNGAFELAFLNTSAMKMGFVCNKKQSTGVYIYDGNKTFSRPDAVRECERRGTTLHEFTLDLITDLKSLPRGKYWIGLKRNYTWLWLNGQPMTREPSNPPDAATQCVGITRSNVLTPNSYRCADQKRYICVPRQIKKFADVSTVAWGTHAPRSSTPRDWREWVGVGVGGGVAFIFLIAGILVAFSRLRKMSYTPKESGDEGRVRPKLKIESSIMEPEYSDVRDVIIGGTTPPPDAVEGIYTEPCRESGHFGSLLPKTGIGGHSIGNGTTERDNEYVKKTSNENNELLKETETQYAIPETVNFDNTGYVTSIETMNKCDDDEYGVPGVGDSFGAHSNSVSTPRRDDQGSELGYDIPRSASFTARTRRNESSEGISGRSQGKDKGWVNTKPTSKWEPGRYDVPRSNDSINHATPKLSDSRLRGNHNQSADSVSSDQSAGSGQYHVPQTSNQIYSVPRT